MLFLQDHGATLNSMQKKKINKYIQWCEMAIEGTNKYKSQAKHRAEITQYIQYKFYVVQQQ